MAGRKEAVEEPKMEAVEEPIRLEKEKYKIQAPTLYCGLIAKIPFVQGIGVTSDDWLANWFETRGYLVTLN